jgi:hypothetical protein
MDEVIVKVLADLSLSESRRDVWEPLIPHIVRVVDTSDDAFFLAAVEELARSAGLAGSSSVETLFQGFGEGCDLVRRQLASAPPTEESEAWRRVVALEREALTRLAGGYASGLRELIVRLEQQAELLSPVDAVTGALRPQYIAERLALEVQRSRRMQLPLGVVELSIGDDERRAVACSDPLAFPAARAVAVGLREGIRPYDSIGLTEDGSYLIVLPDVSRRGLAGVAERLSHGLAGSAAGLRPSIGLEHLDPVDVTAGQIMWAVHDGVLEARALSRSPVWAEGSGSGRAA